MLLLFLESSTKNTCLFLNHKMLSKMKEQVGLQREEKGSSQT